MKTVTLGHGVTNIIPNKYTMAKRTGLWTGVNKNELQDITWII
jgi:hypothetical protein